METENMERDYIKEFEYRKQLKLKAVNKTITKEDRFWLVTNPVYNLRWGELTYNTVIENIKPKTKYIL
ncbi:MAG: hypothetical protein IIV99_06385, partial [Oscillospiraceae bacterium]|nr:hypothetical protein [Oscillospiraceae bacterium]